MEGRIGEVFTPPAWAVWAVREFGLYDKWKRGASVFDPTMGDGALLEAFAAAAKEDGLPLDSLPFDKLYGVEIKPAFRDAFLERMKSRYGLDLPGENFRAGDFLLFDRLPEADLLFGNPPWITFAALPEEFKTIYRKKFLDYGLVASRRNVLLGNSRTDLAALVVRKALAENLVLGGEAVFFLPLSLFFNDGANAAFRSPREGFPPVRVERIYDLAGTDAFPEVSTRCGVARFVKGEDQSFPVAFFRRDGDGWRSLRAGPSFDAAAPWGVFDEPGLGAESAAESASEPVLDAELIPVPRESAPRQGVNTSGANDLFFFDKVVSERPGFLRLSNSAGNEAVLPASYVFPCLRPENFSEPEAEPRRWVLLPYGENGKPLTAAELEDLPELRAYLLRHRERLASRKGVLIGSWIRRGLPWALLGVGPYCFFPWKIVWEAYGRSRFAPRIFPGRWQANQALQCYIPFRSREDCEAVFRRLGDGRAERYLLSLNMAGTMNWAQPGKVRRLLRLDEGGAS